jgi:DnaK suppressor protein
MDEVFLAEMGKALTSLRDDLQVVAETAEASAQTVELDQQRVGRLSRMDAMQAQAMAQESARRRESLIRGIAAALSRLESGDFGYCQGCEESINQNRLRFDPTATLCIDCASRAEGSQS